MNHWITLPERALIAITGPDRLTFLQGLVTQDVRALTDRCVFSALLTAKGFFQSDFFLIPTHHSVYVECHETHLASLLETLRFYAPLHDVEVRDATKDYAVCAAMGPDVGSLCNPEEQPLFTDAQGAIWYVDPRHEAMGLRALVPYQYLHVLPHPLLSAQLPEVYHRKRIFLGIPEGASDLIVGKSIILEYGYNGTHALSWNKGCYLGQELMARTYHRGEIRKAVYSLEVVEGSVPPVGEALFFEEEKIGIMGGHLQDVALACLYKERAESLPASFALTYAGGTCLFRKTGVSKEPGTTLDVS